jgi:hypothetical protein
LTPAFTFANIWIVEGVVWGGNGWDPLYKRPGPRAQRRIST